MARPVNPRWARAAEQLRVNAGIDPTVESLLGRLTAIVGQDEAAAAALAVKAVVLIRRASALGSLVAAVVAMRELGATWWFAEQEGGAPGPGRMSPAQFVRLQPHRVDMGVRYDPLEALYGWAAENVADARWGVPLDDQFYPDEGFPARLEPPVGSKPGDQLVVAWEVGCRCPATVVIRPDGGLVAEVDRENLLRSTPVEAWWAWHHLAGSTPQPLPGEVAGTGNDPYSVALDRGAAEPLRLQARAMDPSVPEFNRPWVTVGDALRALDAAAESLRVWAHPPDLSVPSPDPWVTIADALRAWDAANTRRSNPPPWPHWEREMQALINPRP